MIFAKSYEIKKICKKNFFEYNNICNIYEMSLKISNCSIL